MTLWSQIGSWFSPRPATPVAPISPPSPPSSGPTYRDLVLSLLREFEGCVLHPYQDTGGVWTIGYGNTRINGEPVTCLTPCLTQAQADALLFASLPQREAAVDRLVSVPLSDGERAALVSFVWNEGVGQFASSTLLRKLNAGDRVGAAAEFPRWNLDDGRVLPGLVRRRAAERAVFEGKPIPV